MSANPVERLVRAEGSDDSVIFVFPSDVAAGLWLEAALAITGRDTLPSRRFIAWDRFKEQSVQASVAGKQPVSATVRQLDALALARRNADSSPRLFSSLIPEPYATEGSVFAAWISRLLPSLALLERMRLASRSGRETDAEDRDLSTLKADYAHFLESNSLFEPSWQRPPLRDTGDHFVIFFPEAIEDFAEYAELLADAPFIRTVSAYTERDEESEAEFHLSTHETTRDEIRQVALDIESIIRKGGKPEDIAVSVPDIENVAPYVLREFSLRGIPVEYRAGSPLSRCPGGRLFPLLEEAVSAGFAFTRFKTLLLDRVIPWKHRQLAEDLVDFGIRNHCVTGWRDDGKTIDVWDAAFEAPSSGESGDWRLRDWYRKLRDTLSSIVGAASFTEIRNRYFVFRETFLDMSLLSPEDDAVLARCVEELNALASLESRFAALIPERPYALFVSMLDEKRYVPKRTSRGVNVFPYRVAAGTPFPWHFVIDASQDNATVVYSPLDYLRQDKRESLSLMDVDASRAFFSLYRRCPLEPPVTGTVMPGARFSCAVRSFSGYRTAHSAFEPASEARADTPHDGSDPFLAEAEWLTERGNEPDRLYPAQKSGFASWRAMAAPRGFSYLTGAYAARVDALTARIQSRTMNRDGRRVTATDLNTFALCGAKWFLGTVLAIKEEAYDAELMNERNLGILYHDVLFKVYSRIRETDGGFNGKNIDAYKSWAAEAASTAARDHDEFAGPLVEPLIDTLADRITEGVCRMLECDREKLDGYAPVLLEESLTFAEGGLSYYGRIDRVSARPGDLSAVLIDYKSGWIPKTGDYAVKDGQGIGDYQMPMYAFLAERAEKSPCKGTKLEFAWFGNIKDGKYQPVINDPEIIGWHARTKSFTRDEFEESMQAFGEMTARFADCVESENFVRPGALPWKECVSCSFRKICRYVYSVRP